MFQIQISEGKSLTYVSSIVMKIQVGVENKKTFEVNKGFIL